MDYKLTIATLISAIIIAVALYQAYSSSLLNIPHVNTSIPLNYTTFPQNYSQPPNIIANYTPYTNTIPTDNLNTKACAKPFNKNYMGWAPISNLRKYGFGYTEDLAPEYEKNPLLFLKIINDNVIVVHAKVISLGEAYQDGTLSHEYSLRYKILILDIIINKSSLSLNVGETIDVYYTVYNLEVLKQIYYSGTINVTGPKVIENVNPRQFTGLIMPLDVGNEYILYLSYAPSNPSKIYAGSPYFVFDSKVYSPDNVSYPVDSEPYTKAFYKVCGMPLSDFANLIKNVNS
jgi:hypothetical protein